MTVPKRKVISELDPTKRLNYYINLFIYIQGASISLSLRTYMHD